MSQEGYDLVYNKTSNGLLTEQRLSDSGAIAFFEGASASPAMLEAEQWLKAIIEDKEPLVKPEQAFMVTKILDLIYKSAELGKEIIIED